LNRLGPVTLFLTAERDRSFAPEAGMRFRRFLMLVMLICLPAAVAQAGNPDRAGTSGAGELRIPASARGTALGNGVMADIEGAEAIYYNPAGLSGLGGADAYFAHLDYIADMDKNYFAGAVKTAYGAFGITVDVLSVGDVLETTESSPDGTGRTFSPTLAVIGGTYAQFLTGEISVGASVKMVHESIPEASAAGVAFDIGLQYRPTWRRVRLGLALKDLGPRMQYSGNGLEAAARGGGKSNTSPRSSDSQSGGFELPASLQAGLAFRVLDRGENRVHGYGCFVWNSFDANEYHLSAEYSFRSILALRGGLAASGPDDNFGPSFGMGLKLPVGGSCNGQFDYAMRTVTGYFDHTQVFSIKFTF
jgi:hypothetical protein